MSNASPEEGKTPFQRMQALVPLTLILLVLGYMLWILSSTIADKKQWQSVVTSIHNTTPTGSEQMAPILINTLKQTGLVLEDDDTWRVIPNHIRNDMEFCTNWVAGISTSFTSMASWCKKAKKAANTPTVNTRTVNTRTFNTRTDTTQSPDNHRKRHWANTTQSPDNRRKSRGDRKRGTESQNSLYAMTIVAKPNCTKLQQLAQMELKDITHKLVADGAWVTMPPSKYDTPLEEVYGVDMAWFQDIVNTCREFARAVKYMNHAKRQVQLLESTLFLVFSIGFLILLSIYLVYVDSDAFNWYFRCMFSTPLVFIGEAIQDPKAAWAKIQRTVSAVCVIWALLLMISSPIFTATLNILVKIVSALFYTVIGVVKVLCEVMLVSDE
jgi:hypothetical protein